MEIWKMTVAVILVGACLCYWADKVWLMRNRPVRFDKLVQKTAEGSEAKPVDDPHSEKRLKEIFKTLKYHRLQPPTSEELDEVIRLINAVLKVIGQQNAGIKVQARRMNALRDLVRDMDGGHWVKGIDAGYDAAVKDIREELSRIVGR